MPDVFAISYAALWILVVLQALILLGLTRAFAEMRGATPERPSLKGQRAPQFSAVDLAGHPITTATMAGKPAVLLFVSPSCASCRVTLAELRAIASDTTRDLTVVCEGEDAGCRELAAEYSLAHPMVADASGELKRIFGVIGTPMAVRISAEGVIESYGEPAREELEQLLTASGATGQESARTRAGKATADDYTNV